MTNSVADGATGGKCCIAVGIVTMAALLLRLFRLDAQPLWLDESFTWHAAEIVRADGPFALLQFDHISPGYYIVATMAAQVGTLDAWWLRLPSALAGAAAVPLTHWVAMSITGRRGVGLAAACFMAVSPAAIWYSQEARGYAVLLAISTLYIGLTWRALSKECGVPTWVGLTVAAALMLWFHHTGAFLFVVGGVAALAEWGLRRRAWLWLSCHLVALASFFPWLLGTSDDVTGSLSSSGMDGIVTRAAYNAFSLVVGTSWGPSVREVREGDVLGVLMGHLPALVAALIVALLVVIGATLAMRQLERRANLFLLLWLIVPGVVLLVGVMGTSILLHARYTIGVLPAIATLVGLAIAGQPRRVLGWLVAVGTAAICAWSTANWFFDPQYGKENFSGAAEVLQEQLAPDDLLLIANENSMPPLAAYGLTCPSNSLTIRGSVALDSLADQPIAASGRTFVIESRQWESVPGSVLDPVLDDRLGPATQTWDWTGVSLSVRPRSFVAASAEGLQTGCPW